MRQARSRGVVSVLMDNDNYSGYNKSATVGNQDSEGALILKNNSVFKTNQHMYVGYENCGNAAHGTYEGLTGDDTYFTSNTAQTGHISVESGSKLYTGDGFTISNDSALTVYISQGSNIVLDDSIMSVDGQQFVVGDDTEIIVDLGNVAYEEGTPLFTLTGTDNALLTETATAMQEKATVTWTDGEGQQLN